MYGPNGITSKYQGYVDVVSSGN